MIKLQTKPDNLFDISRKEEEKGDPRRCLIIISIKFSKQFFFVYTYFLIINQMFYFLFEYLFIY